MSDKLLMSLICDKLKKIGLHEKCNDPNVYELAFCKALEKVEGREKKIIEMRYKQGMTLQECAKRENVCGQRIGQLEYKALRKIIHYIEKYVAEAEGKEFDADVETLDMGYKCSNSLKRGGIKTISDLKKITVDDLLDFRGLGPKTVRHICEKAKEQGIDIKRKDEKND